MATEIKYVTGDATRPINDADVRVIVHCCNDVGAWGAGFVLALTKRDDTPEQMYKDWARCKGWSLTLGEIQVAHYAEKGLFVANIIGQHQCGADEYGLPPIRYDAINEGLRRLRGRLLVSTKNRDTVAVHAPRFGAGLAGGDWGIIEKLIINEICAYDIPVTIYDFE